MRQALQSLVDDLAERTGRPVTLSDATCSVLAYSAQPTGVDGVRMQSILERRAPAGVLSWVRANRLHLASAPVRPRVDERLSMQSRVCAPARRNGTLFGYLWVIDEERALGDAAMTLIGQAAQRAGDLLARWEGQHRAQTAEERRLLNRLFAGSDSEVFDELRQRHRLYHAEGLAVMAARLSTRSSFLAAASQGPLGRTAGTMSTVVPIRDAWFCLVVGDESLQVHASDRVRELIKRSVPRQESSELAIGCSTAGPLADATGMGREADIAAIVAAVEGRPVVRWEELGSDAAVASAVRAGAVRRDPLLVRLAAEDRHGHLRQTLHAYLVHAGDAQATAAALHLHRTSLYYRLDRIETIMSLSLRDGRHRLRLHNAIRIDEVLLHLGDG